MWKPEGDRWLSFSSFPPYIWGQGLCWLTGLLQSSCLLLPSPGVTGSAVSVNNPTQVLLLLRWHALSDCTFSPALTPISDSNPSPEWTASAAGGISWAV